MDKNFISASLQSIQDDICTGLEVLDGTATFHQDLWTRPGGGGGRTRILQGDHIEKGGVNFSAVHGELTTIQQKSLGINDAHFFATGVSIVLHPSNPFVPIIHMNVRYFESGDQWWYGGGIDVTPHYINKAEAAAFHRTLRVICDKTNADFYARHKAWADDYFYIKHRSETRGVGGIFFDKLTHPEVDKSKGFTYIKNIAESFVSIYTALFTPNYTKAYTEANKEWQLLRRGRYVEFNLVWDRGTKFGLETDGRTESILMSLPKDARWIYDFKVEENSAEAETLALLRKGVDWGQG
jgi:coproporphyrinogen III oxidase